MRYGAFSVKGNTSALQAEVPGSIPGKSIIFLSYFTYMLIYSVNKSYL